MSEKNEFLNVFFLDASLYKIIKFFKGKLLYLQSYTVSRSKKRKKDE